MLSVYKGAMFKRETQKICVKSYGESEYSPQNLAFTAYDDHSEVPSKAFFS